jgi:putative phosphoribosyl transferase
MLFQDREDAGMQLAAHLQSYKNHPSTVVLGLARGGVVVAHTVAKLLSLPLDVLIVRKIGAPYNPELAIGAVDETGHTILNEPLIETLGVTPTQIEAEVLAQKEIAKRRASLYRSSRKRVALTGKEAILIDDGIATGATVEAAIWLLRLQKVKTVILAIRVAAPDSLAALSNKVDQVVCLYTPHNFQAVGQFYNSFEQTTDEEVIRLLVKFGISP